MIPIAKPFLGGEEKEAVAKVLDSGMLAQGEVVREFEQKFAEFVGVKHAIATSSGTTALHAGLLAHGIKPGDEVITTPFTFIATANAIRMVGATPIFVDIEEKTFNINPDLIESVITDKTKAILPVHLFGLPANIEKIKKIADDYNLHLIEDVCQAHGAQINDKKVGSFGTGCFSFYPTKNMTTGEGGMITTNNDEIADKVRKIINHGSTEKYFHESHGFNYRMTDISAAIGIVQLKRVDEFTRKRRNNANFLNTNINSPNIINPDISESHVFHQYTVRVTNNLRDSFARVLKENNIGYGIFYPLPIHKQKSYFEYNYLKFPVAEKVSKEVLSLPIHPQVSENDFKKIVEVLNNQ